ncbi:MAG: class I SAM-dependent methyltransferase [Treponema sp.]|nr:class I SAM-dependent methyltransferase [Treponema sp.]
MNQKTAAQAEMLANRLRKRYRHLKKWAARTDAGAFRLYDRDIPEIPLVLDWYGGAVSGALYKRPYEKDGEDEKRWIEEMRNAAARALEIPAGRVFIKFRERKRGAAQYEKLSSGADAKGSGFIRDIREGGLVFRVNLSDYLDTGLFPDRRGLRDVVRKEAAGKRMLNLFCYTAAFSVCAAAGGAEETDSVDLSNTYLAWAGVNFSLNGFRAETVSEREALYPAAAAPGIRVRHRLIRADALLFLKHAAAAKRKWDLVIMDPPAFSNSRKMASTLDIKRDHRELAASALRLLAPGGRLYFAAGVKNFRLETNGFPGFRAEDIRARAADEDFPPNKAPSCYVFQNTDSST